MRKRIKLPTEFNLRPTWSIFLILFIIFSFVIFRFNVSLVYAEENDNNNQEFSEEDLSENISSQLDEIDFSELEIIAENNNFGQSLFGENLSFKEIAEKIIAGEFLPDYSNFLNSIFNGIKIGIKSLVKPCIVIFVFLAIFAIFNAMGSKMSGETNKVIRFVIVAAITIILVQISAKVIYSSLRAINEMQSQINAVFPIILGLVTAIGGVGSASVIGPSIVMLTNFISNIFSKVLFSIFSFCLVLTIADSFSEEKKLNKLIDFFKSSFKTIIAIVGSVFTFILSASGISAAVSDNLSIKAAKYSIKNYVPYLGGYISDGLGLMKLAAIIIKNGIGLAAIFLLVGTVILFQSEYNICSFIIIFCKGHIVVRNNSTVSCDKHVPCCFLATGRPGDVSTGCGDVVGQHI